LKRLIYIKTNNNEVVCSGISVKEFLELNSIDITNVAAITEDNSKFVEKINIKDNIEFFDNVQVGDLFWTNYSSEIDVNLESILIKSFSTQDFNNIVNMNFENNYICYTHDNGWNSKILCKDIKDFYLTILNIICYNSNIKVDNLKNKNELIEKIIALSEKGIIIKINNILMKNIEIIVVGEHLNMDDLFNNMKRYSKKELIRYKIKLKKNIA